MQPSPLDSLLAVHPWRRIEPPLLDLDLIGALRDVQGLTLADPALIGFTDSARERLGRMFRALGERRHQGVRADARLLERAAIGFGCLRLAAWVRTLDAVLEGRAAGEPLPILEQTERCLDLTLRRLAVFLDQSAPFAGPVPLPAAVPEVFSVAAMAMLRRRYSPTIDARIEARNR